MKNLIHKSFLSAVALSSIAFSILVILLDVVVGAQTSRSQPLPSWTGILHVLFAKKPPLEPHKSGSREHEGDDQSPLESDHSHEWIREDQEDQISHFPKDEIDNEFCMISPDEPSVPRVVWSDRPLFVWKGNINKIDVIQDSTSKTLWSQTVDETAYQIYTGKPLHPGQIYQLWVFVGDSPNHPVTFIQFQIMESQRRDRITAELQVLENQLKAKHSSPEAIALAKAKYFAKLNLWSDVLQQVYSVQKPSAELTHMRYKIIHDLCE